MDYNTFSTTNKSDLGETSGTLRPVWFDLKHQDRPKFPSLTKNLQTEVLIVGAGMAGLTSSYSLAKAGKKVTLIESRQIASGETSRSTAHLMSAFDDHFHYVAKSHGNDVAKLVAESHSRAIDWVEKICKDEGIECGWKRVDGYLFPASEKDVDFIKQEEKAAKEAGLTNVEIVQKIPSLNTKDTMNLGLKFPGQGKFNPLTYSYGLAEVLSKKYGVDIYCDTHAMDFQSGKPAVVTTKNGSKITADYVILATNVPVNDRFQMYTKMEANRTNAISVKIPKGSVPDVLWWDTLEDYHYVRLDSYNDQFDVLTVGGEDYRVGMMDDYEEPFMRLLAWTLEKFPVVNSSGKSPFGSNPSPTAAYGLTKDRLKEIYQKCGDLIVEKWSGQVQEPTDMLAYIGRNPSDTDNIFIVTGDSGNGITHGSIASMLLRDLILGIPNKWASVYDPNRLPKSKSDAAEFVLDNVKTGYTYKDWLTPGEIKDIEDLKPGCGAIMRDGLTKVAVYKDEKGTVHQHSAICPHLKAIVHWNPIEKSFDCPAHGSRFDAFGKVICGPAISNLAPVNKQSK